ncbi:MAG: OFA family MFS transporter [Desulfovibrionaceae bacterium]|nr:OFA family MFS transporter [Desulfovibrionaceae bacterium]
MIKNRYLMLFFGFVIACFLGVLYAWSVFVIPLERSFGWERPETQMTFSLLMAFFCLGMLTSGLVIKKAGPSLTVLAGGLLGGIGFYAASYTDSLLWIYVSYGVIAGFGIGLANVVLTSVILRWFADKRGFASGILTAGLALGTFFLGSKTAPHLINQFGWEGTFRALGIAYWVIICPLALLIRFPKDEAASARKTGEKAVWGIGLSQMLKIPAAWYLTGWLLFIHTGGLMIIAHVAPYAQSLGFSPETAAFVMGVLALANAGGRFLFGYLSDKLGRKPTLVLSSLTIISGLLALAFLPASMGYTALLIGVIVTGLSYGGSIPQLATLISAFFGPRNFTTNYGFIALASMVAAILGPYIGSQVMHSFNYQIAILCAAVVAGLSVIMALLIRNPQLPQE